MNTEKRQVLLGMSGGTDSSVAAMLLQDQGYDVIGVTFRFYELNDSRDYLNDAAELAERLGIRHLVYDARDQFEAYIVRYFVAEYFAGRTPVPCILCNNYLKWPLLAKIADEMGITYISTGHYVRKILIGETYYLTPGVDRDKDQSFFLWGLSQDLLRRMVLPMGDIIKTEARALALERGYAKVSKKKDSLGVCFCPMDYRTFLKNDHNPPSLLSDKRGRFVDEEGRFIAWHEGYPYYTIGQRRGLGIHLNKAVFVKEIHPETNEIVLSDLRGLEKRGFFLKEWNVVDESLLFGHDEVIVKIRYRKQANRCRVSRTSSGQLFVDLLEPLTAIALGQAAAFYHGELLIGGGIIEAVL